MQTLMKFRKTISLAVVLLMTAFLSVGVHAQTYKYKLVKIVDREDGTEYPLGFQPDIRYITFTGNSFQFTDKNGNPIPFSESTKFSGSWSYCNIKYRIQGDNIAYITIPVGVFNPRIFTYVGDVNGKKKYHNRRPVYSRKTNQDTGYYIDDYIYFTPDMKRFNIKSGGNETENGISGDGSSAQLCAHSNIYVYDLIEDDDEVFY